MSAKKLEQEISYLQHIGVTVSDHQSFTRQVKAYGYDEIVSQYLPHFVVDPRATPLQLKRPTDFNDISDLYWLDQHLKNTTMIGLQLFEQSFKVTLSRKLRELQQDKQQAELLKPSYQMQNGRTIKRGDLKARLRHIKKYYLEPYPGYREKTSGKPSAWVLVKEMSFGIATNAFFLLEQPVKKEILQVVFQRPCSLISFEQITADLRVFRGRAAHNYRLIGLRLRHHSIYPLVLAELSLLTNQDPFIRVSQQLQKVCEHYLISHPEERTFITNNVVGRK